MEQLFQAIADDWQALQEIRERLPRRIAQALRRGAPGRLIARKTEVPEANIRRWTKDDTAAGETAGAA